jgi:hypothetical protein
LNFKKRKGIKRLAESMILANTVSECGFYGCKGVVFSFKLFGVIWNTNVRSVLRPDSKHLRTAQST